MTPPSSPSSPSSSSLQECVSRQRSKELSSFICQQSVSCTPFPHRVTLDWWSNHIALFRAKAPLSHFPANPWGQQLAAFRSFSCISFSTVRTSNLRGSGIQYKPPPPPPLFQPFQVEEDDFPSDSSGGALTFSLEDIADIPRREAEMILQQREIRSGKPWMPDG